MFQVDGVALWLQDTQEMRALAMSAQHAEITTVRASHVICSSYRFQMYCIAQARSVLRRPLPMLANSAGLPWDAADTLPSALLR